MGARIMLTLNDTLSLDIKTHWDGRACADPRLCGSVKLTATAEGIWLEASLPEQPVPSVPACPPGRVDSLWEYDVVECFLVGSSRYLEVELGPGGHYLMLEFDAPRRRCDELHDFRPVVKVNKDEGRWTSRVLVPWERLPAGLCRVNAFCIVRGNFLCAFPTLGSEPDFHRPERFPELRCQRPDVPREASAFALPPMRAARPIGPGLINRTYLLSGDAGQWVLQQLHPVVPDEAVEDMHIVTGILREYGLRVPSLLRSGQGWVAHTSTGRWRAYPWLEGKVSEAVTGESQAFEAGRLLGQMHEALRSSTYQPRGSIPHFHDTEWHRQRLAAVAGLLPDSCREEAQEVLSLLPSVILPAGTQSHQLIHGDPKISNILFDHDSAVGLIDFDTLMRNMPLIDIGDALRSWCNSTTEYDADPKFNTSYAHAAWAGYSEGNTHAPDFALALRAAKQITLELCCRFLVDVVEDVYFGFDGSIFPTRRDANVARALGQFRLALDI